MVHHTRSLGYHHPPPPPVYAALSGTLPSQLRALKFLQHLSVNNNKLNGPISTTLTKMVRLTYINTCSNLASFKPLPQWVNRGISVKC
jgi:hypothetical protein